MKKKIIYLIGGILIIGLLFFIRTLFSDFSTTSVEEIKIEEGKFYDDQGTPFSGTLKAEDEGINDLFQGVVGTFPSNFFSWISRGPNPEKLPKEFIESLKGIVLHINIENGKPTGETEIYYDVREGRDEVFQREIDKGFGYYTSYLFSNRIKIASVSFKDGALDGSSYLINPSTLSEQIKLVEVNFSNNQIKYMKSFYESGEVRSVENYKDFKRDGLQEGFYRDGQLKYETHIENGMKTWEKAYYNKPHSLRKESKYNLYGMVESTSEFYPDGEKLYIMNDSIKKEWYSNGEIKMMVTNDTMISNLPKGEIKTYHSNGQLNTTHVYNESGQQDGPYVIYYKNGEMWEKGTMKNGENHGNLKKWYNNKQLAEDHQMVNGKREGKYIRYYDNGQMWKEFNYKNGELHGPYKKWWKNGQLAEDHKMVNGEIDGKYVRYYDNGQMWKEFNYNNGKLTGVAKKWWQNGQMASKCDYSSGNKECESWDDEGNLLD